MELHCVPGELIGLSTNLGAQDFINKYRYLKERNAHVLMLPPAQNTNELTIYLNECTPQKLWFNDDIIDLTAKAHKHSLPAPCTLFFTSGSTAAPKAVVHLDTSLESSANESLMALRRQIVCDRPLNLITPLPTWHVGGLLNEYRRQNLAQVTWCKRQDIAQFIKKDCFNLLVIVPTQFLRILEDNSFPHQQCVYYIGGGPLHLTAQQSKKASALTYFLSYGMTESAGAVAQAKGSGPFTLMKQVNAHHNSQGVIEIKTPRLAIGYIVNNQLTPLPLSRHFFTTSDRGKVHNNQITITGRHDQVFISGGENISPHQLEQKVIAQRDSITAAKVLPYPHLELDHEIILFIKTSPENFLKEKQHILSTSSPLDKPHHIYPWPQHKGIKPSKDDFLSLHSRKKKLLFIHGFMGRAQEFHFMRETGLYLELHFITIQETLEQTLSLIKEIDPHYIYGYSLGGRIALQYSSRHCGQCEHIFLESSSFGLKEPKQRQERRQLDRARRQELTTHRHQFLNNWYQLPLWGELSASQRESLVHDKMQRTSQEYLNDQCILENYSPGKLPFISIESISINITCIYGEQDHKYKTMIESLSGENIQKVMVNNVGHNVHRFAEHTIKQIIEKQILQYQK